jgi:cullin 3
LSFEELYRNAYKVVLKKKGDVLYERVSLLEESWLRDTVRVNINQFVTSSIILGAAGESFAGQSTERRIAGERFMRELKDAFSDHQLCMGMITDVLMYMVRPCSPPPSKSSVKVETLVAPGPCYTVLFTPAQDILSAIVRRRVIALRRPSQTTPLSTLFLKQPY